MTAIIDTNVILDVLLARAPFFADSSLVVSKAELGEYSGIICATTITNIFYIARKSLGRADALKAIDDLVSIFAIAPVNRSVIHDALHSTFNDFEDSILNFSGKAAGAKYVITRNEPDFASSDLIVYNPTQFLAALP